MRYLTGTYNFSRTRKYDRDKYRRIGLAIEHFVWRDGNITLRECSKKFALSPSCLQQALKAYYGDGKRPVQVSFYFNPDGTMQTEATTLAYYE
jgi:hypothetical protein